MRWKYSSVIGQTHYELVWLPQIKQAAPLIRKSEKNTLKTVMAGRSSPNQTSQFFAKGQGHQTMNFADIGDNEVDPFISAMINQGFVEHDERHH